MGPGWIRNLGPLSRVCPWVRGCAVLRTTWAQTPSTGTWATVRGALFFVHRAGVREAGGRHFNQDATGVSAWAGPRGVHKSLRATDLSRVGTRARGWENCVFAGKHKKAGVSWAVGVGVPTRCDQAREGGHTWLCANDQCRIPGSHRATVGWGRNLDKPRRNAGMEPV